MRDLTVDRSFAALGTEIRIVVSAPDAVVLASRAEAEILDYHRRLSRFLPGSELSMLNADPRARVPASPLLREAVRAALWAARHSNGLVDPCLLGELEAAGYRRSLAGRAGRAAPALPPPDMPARPAQPAASAPWRRLCTDETRGAVVRPPGMRLDLGGSGKGHVADRVAHMLAPARRWVVDCGGDLRVGGAGAAHDIHVAHPLGGVIEVLRVAHAAVATSSIVSRTWRAPDGGRAHHLLDPSTGKPAWTGLLSVTALASSTLEAETVAKAALLSGPAGARRALARRGGILVHANGDAERVGPIAAAAVRAAA